MRALFGIQVSQQNSEINIGGDTAVRIIFGSELDYKTLAVSGAARIWHEKGHKTTWK